MNANIHVSPQRNNQYAIPHIHHNLSACASEEKEETSFSLLPVLHLLHSPHSPSPSLFSLFGLATRPLHLVKAGIFSTAYFQVRVLLFAWRNRWWLSNDYTASFFFLDLVHAMSHILLLVVFVKEKVGPAM